MSSSGSDLLSELLDKTERNLKRIENIDGAFNCYVLNEWRYATRHVVDFMQTGSPEQKSKAIGHLKRAYYDSCDILIDGLLARVASYEARFCGYVNVVAAVIPDLAKHYKHVHDAKAKHMAAQVGHGDEREQEYNRLEDSCEHLWKFVDELETTRRLWDGDIQKQKNRDRLPIVLALVGIAVSILLAAIF